MIFSEVSFFSALYIRCNWYNEVYSQDIIHKHANNQSFWKLRKCPKKVSASEFNSYKVAILDKHFPLQKRIQDPDKHLWWMVFWLYFFFFCLFWLFILNVWNGESSESSVLNSILTHRILLSNCSGEEGGVEGVQYGSTSAFSYHATDRNETCSEILQLILSQNVMSLYVMWH